MLTRLLFGLLTLLPLWTYAGQADSGVQNADVALLPSMFANSAVTPKVILSMDTSMSMHVRAYEKGNFDPNTTYHGIFESDVCYSYDREKHYFYRDGSTSGSCKNWQGNFINWLTVSRLDVIRKVLVGGRIRYAVNTTAGVNYLTRLEFANSGYQESDIAYYVREAEDMTVFSGDWWANNNAFNKKSNKSATYTPFNNNRKYAVCRGKFMVLRLNYHKFDGRDYDNHDGKKTRGLMVANRCPSAEVVNANGIDQFKLRVRSEMSEPIRGLLIDTQDQYSYGVSVFNYDHSRSLNIQPGADLGKTIYLNSKTDGGTLRPCYPDWNKENPTTYDKCFESYAGAPVKHLVDIIEYYPMIGETTPMAETLMEVSHYIKQKDFSSGGQPAKKYAGPQFYENGLVPNSANNMDASSYQLANVASGQSDNPHWDPYYNAGAGGLIGCTPVSVISLNDGDPYRDFNGYLSRHPGIESLWGSAVNEESTDSAAWAMRGDCRADLEGVQDVKTYFVFADLSNALTNDSDPIRRLREAAAIGGAAVEVNEDTGEVSLADRPFFSWDSSNQYDPLSGLSSGFENIRPQEPRGWDKNGDGEPDHLFIATSMDQLKTQLQSVLARISQNLAASSNAAVVARGGAGPGAIYQGLFYPSLEDANNSSVKVNWAGSLWGLFVDDQGRFREDTNGNGKMDTDTKVDHILTYDNDPIGGTTLTRSTEDQVVETGIPLKDINSIWSLSERLSEVETPVQQRVFSVSNGERHIVTGAMSVKSSAHQTQHSLRSFIADSFDYQDAPWFDLDCENLSNSECTEKVQQLVNFLRGEEYGHFRNRTIDLGQGPKVQRLGDLVNSSPAVVGAPKENYDKRGDSSYAEFKERYKDRREMIYVGSNGGMLHAVNGGFWDETSQSFKLSVESRSAHPLGSELWAYVPVNLYPHLKWLSEPAYQHVFYVDGDPQSFDVKIFPDDIDHPNGWGTILVATMRMGGKAVTLSDGNVDHRFGSAIVVLDITNPEKPPQLLAEYTDTELGFTTSKPALFKDMSRALQDWKLIFGSGPTELNNTSSTQVPRLFVMDLLNRKVSKHLVPMFEPAYLGDITVADWEKDAHLADDDIFFGTVQGQGNDLSGALIHIPAEDLGSLAGMGYQLLNPERPISAAPEYFMAGGTRWLYVGTGKSLSPADNAISQQQYFYGLKVPALNRTITTRLIDTSSFIVKTDGTVLCGGNCPNTTSKSMPYTELQTNMRGDGVNGWKVALHNGVDRAANDPSGRSVAKATINNENVLFTDFTPPQDICDVGGVTYLYGLNFLTGTATPGNLLGEDDDVIAPPFVDFGQGQAKELDVISAMSNTPTVLSQDSTGSLLKFELNVESLNDGRVNWRQLKRGI